MLRYPIIHIVLLLLFCAAGYSQQTGELHGVITDQTSGEKLIGVNIVLVGTSIGAATDIDGKYTIHRIPPGTYDVRISAVGYAPKTITKLAIPAGAPTEMSVTMSEDTYMQKEVVITAEEIKSTENTILSQRKRASAISDGISAETIKKTPDATSGDALKRVTGVSIVDNKFVFVRGIPDRYNATTLDGATASGAEVGKKSFSFDLLPANLLDNTSVIKSATPDMRGDFTGGLVQLNTLDFPSASSFRISAASSYNSLSTARDMSVSQGGSHDWIGFDDGTRTYPGDKPDANDIARSAPNTWAPVTRAAPYGGSFSLSYGDMFHLSDADANGTDLGIVAALSYKNSYLRHEDEIYDRPVGRTNIGATNEFDVLWGGIANLSLKFGGLHKISIKNNYNHYADDDVNQYHTQDLGTSTDNHFTVVDWSERSVYTGQIIGDHTFPDIGGTSLSWRASISSSRRDDPDRREVTYYRDLYDPTAPYYAAINQRSWGALNDRASTLGFDITVPVSNAKIKFGASGERKTSAYEVRYFNVTPDYQHNYLLADSLARLPLEYIYLQSHYGTGEFNFTESSKASDSYNGDQDLYAGYVMGDVPVDVLDNKFRIVGGFRVESSTQNISVPKTRDANPEYNTNQLHNVDVLPSVNFTYLLNASTNIRFAYSHSVDRPEFREMAATGFYDFIRYELVGGNPDLKRALAKNTDVRIEFFPEPGELIAASFFHKTIVDAIEEQLVQTATRTRTWYNSPFAENTGFEFEARKSLRFLGEYFGNFLLGGNYTIVKSTVEVSSTTGNSSNTVTTTTTRPLQGQSPYMINLSATFTEPTLRTSISVLYNSFGRRLNTVGFQTSDIYEEARGVTDISITQPLFSSLEAKFTVRNLNNQDKILTQDDLLFERYSIGQTYQLQLSYGF